MGKRDISIIIGGIFFLLFLFFVFFRPDLEDISGKASQEDLLPDDELVLRFDFEQNTFTDLAKSHSGSEFGSIMTGLTGQYDYAWRFAGSTYDYLKISDANDIKGGQPLSISFWIKFAGSPPASVPKIVYKGSEIDKIVDYNISYDSSTKTFACGIENDFFKPIVKSNPDLNPIDEGIWHHVVCVLDKENRNLFLYVDYDGDVNKKTKAVVDDTVAFKSTTNDLYIGQGIETTADNPVKIDSFRVYNKVLSDSEISEIYAGPPSGIIGPLNGLVNYWMMDEGSGNTVKDYIGGKDGTVMGATWVNDPDHGNVLEFDGVDDYVDVSGFDWSTSPYNKLTYAFWIKDDYTVNSQHFIGDAGQSGTSGWIGLSRNTASLVFSYANGISPSNIVIYPYFGTSTVEWKHVVITADYDSDIVNFYKDGNLIGTRDIPNAIPPDSDKLFIGAFSPTDSGGLKGNIYDVRFYNRILNRNEIKSFIPGYTPPPAFPYGTIDLTNALTNVSNSLTGNVSFVVSNGGKKIDNNSYVNLILSKSGYTYSNKLYVEKIMNLNNLLGTIYIAADYDLGDYDVVKGYDSGEFGFDISNFGLIYSGGGTYNLNMSFMMSNGNVYRKSKVLNIPVLPNRAPRFIKVIPNQTWAKGSNNINAFDLDAHFLDPDGDVLNYTYSGLSTPIVIAFNSDGSVNFTQPVNYTGNVTIRFIAEDASDSNQSNVVRLLVGSDVTCVPLWSSGNWSSCSVNDLQTRTVSDLNNCGVITGKPGVNQTCTYSPVSGDDADISGQAAPGEAVGDTTDLKEKPKVAKKGIFSSKVFLSGLIVFIFAGIVVGVYFVQRYRQREIVVTEEPRVESTEAKVEKPKTEKPKLKPVYEEPENVQEMKDYINNMMNKGGTADDIKEALINSGWDKNDVENTTNFVVVERFVKSRMKTMSKEDIKNLLIAKGWGEDLVERVLKGL